MVEVLFGKKNIRGYMYKLHIIKADGGYQNKYMKHLNLKKPSFQDMYPLIGCDFVEMLQGYDKKYLIEKMDLIFILMKKVKKHPFIKNDITLRWLEWLENTGRTAYSR